MKFWKNLLPDSFLEVNYESLIKDLWSLGVVLNRKYTLLRWTYTIFMIGIIASVLAFIIAFTTIDYASATPVIP